MGGILARDRLTLEYGGGRTGLDGSEVEACSHRRPVIGVIVESAHTRLTPLEVTATIHQRKPACTHLQMATSAWVAMAP